MKNPVLLVVRRSQAEKLREIVPDSFDLAMILDESLARSPAQHFAQAWSLLPPVARDAIRDALGQYIGEPNQWDEGDPYVLAASSCLEEIETLAMKDVK